MNYRDPGLRDMLAGEYVLGTLHGAARRRFERLLRVDIDLQDRVMAWHTRLQSMSETLDPVPPGEHVWRNILARIDMRPQVIAPPPFWQRLSVWRGLSAGALAVTVVLAALLLLPMLQPPPAQDAVAVIDDAQTQPLWLLRVDAANKVLEVQVLRRTALDPGKVHELWMLPGGDQAPVSLGLLPAVARESLPIENPQRLLQAAGLAVSLEPAGGSPTGSPTGPVLYQAKLHRL